MKIKIPRKLKALLTTKKRFKIVIGGRGSGKSHTVCDILLAKCQKEGAKIGALREFQSSIEDSIHSLLASEIETLKMPGFEIQQREINHSNGGAFRFFGMARNPESIKSAFGFKYFFVEEAQTISYKSLKMLTPTLRTDDSEIWMVGNPGSSADPFSQRFINPYQSELDRNGYYEDDLHLIIVCNYKDNPFFPPVLEEERLYDYKHLERAEYDHIWMGRFNDSVERAIIKAEWFDAAVDSHVKLGIKPTGAVITSHDPADEGGDSKAYASRKGIHFTDVDEIISIDGNEACDVATGRAIKANTDLFIWDGDGMGALLRRQIADSFKGIKCELRMYRGSNEVEDKKSRYDGLESLGNKDKPKTNADTFYNKRAQYYMKLAQRFYNTYLWVEKGHYQDPDSIISIDSSVKLLDKLRSEVCRIPRKPNGTGKIQLMSKVDMKSKHGIESPGMADCLAMCMEIPDLINKDEEIEYEGWN